MVTMSKHSKDKIFAYLTDLLKPVLRVMSGHAKDADYFVPRTDILVSELGMTEDEVTTCIFPLIGMWRDQQASVGGDDSVAARNFLYVALPFLAEVLLQDGIFWIHDFPDHEISTLLLTRLDGLKAVNYESWAIEKRIYCAGHEALIRNTGTSPCQAIY